MARELTLEQGSQEWLECRKRHITGTEVAHLWCGKDTFKSLKEEKLGIKPVADLSNVPAVKEGKLFEPLIRGYVARKFGNTLCPKTGVIPTPCLEDEDEPFYMVSLDGLTENGEPIEIKNTSSTNLEAFKEVKHKGVFSKSGRGNGYYAQIQWEIYMCKAQNALLVCHQSKDGKNLGEFYFQVIHRDEKVIQELLEIAQAFKAYLIDGIEPSLKIAGRQIGTQGVNQQEVETLLTLYRKANSFYEEAKSKLEKAKEVRSRLTDLLIEQLPTDVDKLETEEYVIARTERVGNINSNKLVNFLIENNLMTQADIENFRNKSSFTNSVKIK